MDRLIREKKYFKPRKKERNFPCILLFHGHVILVVIEPSSFTNLEFHFKLNSAREKNTTKRIDHPLFVWSLIFAIIF